MFEGLLRCVSSWDEGPFRGRLRLSFSCVLPISFVISLPGLHAGGSDLLAPTPTRGMKLRTHDEDLGIPLPLTTDRVRVREGRRRQSA